MYLSVDPFAHLLVPCEQLIGFRRGTSPFLVCASLGDERASRADKFPVPLHFSCRSRHSSMIIVHSGGSQCLDHLFGLFWKFSVVNTLGYLPPLCLSPCSTLSTWQTHQPSSLFILNTATMEFITLAHPDEKDSASLKRQAHSHAARVAHARARRLRMAAHAKQRTDALKEEAQGKASKNELPMTVTRQTNNQEFSRDPALAITMPKTISGAFEHEPLASFIKSLAPREHFIFDHCESPPLPLILKSAFQGH